MICRPWKHRRVIADCFALPDDTPCHCRRHCHGLPQVPVPSCLDVHTFFIVICYPSIFTDGCPRAPPPVLSIYIVASRVRSNDGDRRTVLHMLGLVDIPHVVPLASSLAYTSCKLSPLCLTVDNTIYTSRSFVCDKRVSIVL